MPLALGAADARHGFRFQIAGTPVQLEVGGATRPEYNADEAVDELAQTPGSCSRAPARRGLDVDEAVEELALVAGLEGLGRRQRFAVQVLRHTPLS